MSRQRLSKGLSTSLTSQQVCSNYPGLDVTKTHEYWNDFDNYLSNAGEFTVTTVGSGSLALAAGDGGIVNMATSAGATDSLVITKPVAGFGPAQGCEMWFAAQFALADATNCQVICGMANMLTAPFTLTNITDGFFFNKPSGGTVVNAYVRGSSNSQNLASIGLPTAFNFANATQVSLGIYCDVNGNFTFFLGNTLGLTPSFPYNIEGNKVCTIQTYQTLGSTYFPAVNLTPFVGILNSAAAIKTLSLDYLFAAKIRPNV